ncbi:ABC transporter permease [Paenibacillus chungangensis]|uniref:ABC transporter permease n=1 Tax=Paenibacillus chungangensis TaxID=696535 RepID=A0ABW3HPH2_9BACL
MGNKRSLWVRFVLPVAVMLALVVCWQAAVSFGLVFDWMIPSPLAVVQEAIRPDVWSRLMEHTRATLGLALLGYGGGSAAGFVLAALLHLLPGVRLSVSPLLILSQNVPIIVLAPIMTMLFGYGLLPKVLLLMMVCFFPVCMTMLYALSHGHEAERNYLHMIGCSKWQLFWRLELPGAVTGLFSGLKIGATYSVMSAVVAEWLSPRTGLGGFMVLSSRGYMPERVFASVILIITISIALFGLVTLIERYFTRWRPRGKGGAADA